MNPTFETMVLEDLRAYVLTHREDTPAFHALVDRSRSTTLRTQYPCPNTPANIEIMRQAIRTKLDR
jgi:hypothetical protein